ncbi:hypothetical protein DFH27DRAFT_397205 [Peziza echinospora]|nr:hypothetical protein DFH27DRAFT_397205 [Peziza echinospora]
MSGSSSSAVAVGNNSGSNKPGAVKDLRCYACAPCPTFTNTSHLLTHLASKVHLRTLFELELCATQCGHVEAAEALAKFHKWYAEERLGELLVDRFIVKRGKWSRERSKAETEATEPVGYEEPKDELQYGALRLLSSVNPNGSATFGNAVSGTSNRPSPQPQITSTPQGKRKFEGSILTGTRPPPLRLSASSLPFVVRHSTPPPRLDDTPNFHNTASKSISRIRGGSSSLNAVLNANDDEPLIHLTRNNGSAAGSSYNTMVNGPFPTSGTSSPGEYPNYEEEGLACPEDEGDIVDGPDSGVVYSFKGPRLRGKIWPGMGVFDTAIVPNARRGSSASNIVGVTRPGEPLPFAAATAAVFKTENYQITESNHSRESNQSRGGHQFEESNQDSPNVFVSPSPPHTLSSTPSTCNSNPQNDYSGRPPNGIKHSPENMIGRFGTLHDMGMGDSDIDAEGDIEDEIEYAIRSQLPKASFENDPPNDPNIEGSNPLASDQQKVCPISLGPTSFDNSSSEDKYHTYPLGSSRNPNIGNGCSQEINRELNASSDSSRKMQEKNRLIHYYMSSNTPGRQSSARAPNLGDVASELASQLHEDRGAYETSFGGSSGNLIHVSQHVGLNTLNQAYATIPQSRDPIRYG